MNDDTAAKDVDAGDRFDHLDLLPTGVDATLLRHAVRQEEPRPERVIFVNRALRMGSIDYIGFDLDWTLADYARLPIERLAFELTLEKLIAEHGYPETVRRVEFRPDFPRRGLLVDRQEGAVLKMNRHRYVGRAYLGRRMLPKHERNRLYRREPIELRSDRYYRVNSLFELPEVNLYAEFIELSLHDPPVLVVPSYEKLFKDVRAAIDRVHADGSLKSRILGDLDTYLPRDPLIALALKRLALGGRRLMLITNSEWYYTRALCRHLFDGVLPGVDSWRQLFDLVVVEARKPGFFRKRDPFRAIDEDGSETEVVDVPRWGGVYRGGSREGLMALLGCPGEHVLYVGDHIYGDVVVSKLGSTWRTALILRELEEELATGRQIEPHARHLVVLRGELAELGRRMDDARDVLTLYDRLTGDGANVPLDVAETARTRLDGLESQHRALRHRAGALQERISASFNPTWGSLFKQGASKSLFAAQVGDFACIYTSRVSNFSFYGTDHYFRVLNDPNPHDHTEQ